MVLSSNQRCVHSWLSALESTRWLQHLSVMLKAATLVCSAVEREGRPVLIHCSDGWDRTPQIVALAKILLDPYYRTIEVSVCTNGAFPRVGTSRPGSYTGPVSWWMVDAPLPVPTHVGQEVEHEVINTC